MSDQTWTKRDEVRQRLGNCRRFLGLAWLSLWSDSTVLAAVIFNSVRDEGDGIITQLTMKNGRCVKIPR